MKKFIPFVIELLLIFIILIIFYFGIRMTMIGTVISFNEETYSTTFLCKNCWFDKDNNGHTLIFVSHIPLKVGDKISITFSMFGNTTSSYPPTYSDDSILYVRVLK